MRIWFIKHNVNIHLKCFISTLRATNGKYELNEREFSLLHVNEKTTLSKHPRPFIMMRAL